MNQIVATLREMAHTLEANEHPGQAAYVAALATIGEWDHDAMIPGLCSGAMWGGSGAVWEVGRFPSIDEKHVYWSHLIRLLEQMQSAGIRAERAESLLPILRNWVARGL
jgi:hypothetical protein